MTAEDGDFVELVCEFEEICDPVQVGRSNPQLRDCALADLEVVNPSVLPCHRDVLVAGGEAALRWELPFVRDPGAAGKRGWVFASGDGRALVWTEAWGAPSYDDSAIEIVELRPGAHFEGCIDEADPEASFRCLFDVAARTVTVCEDARSVPFG